MARLRAVVAWVAFLCLTADFAVVAESSQLASSVQVELQRSQFSEMDRDGDGVVSLVELQLSSDKDGGGDLGEVELKAVEKVKAFVLNQPLDKPGLLPDGNAESGQDFLFRKMSVNYTKKGEGFNNKGQMRISKEAYLRMMREKFKEADVDNSNSLNFDEFLSLRTPFPTKYIKATEKAKKEAIELSKVLHKHPTPSFFDTTTFAYVVIAVTFAVVMSSSYYRREAEAHGGRAVMSGLFAATILIFSINSLVMIRMIKRRLNKDFHKRLKYSSDKRAFVWQFLSVVLCLINMYNVEPSVLKTYNAISLISTGVLIVGLIATSYSMLNDEFFQGMVQLFCGHIIVWIVFGLIILQNGDGFEFDEPVSKFDTALYISAITHSTVGYGDVSIGVGQPRRVMMMHAQIVMLLNFVSVLAFVGSHSIEAQGYRVDSKTVKLGYLVTLMSLTVLTLGLITKQGEDVSGIKNIATGIVSGFLTMFSFYKLFWLMQRRTKTSLDQLYSSDASSGAWFWLNAGIMCIFSGCYESWMWRSLCSKLNVCLLFPAEVIGGTSNLALPYITYLILVVFGYKLFKLYKEELKSEGNHASELISMSITIHTNLCITFFFATVYLFAHLHYGYTAAATTAAATTQRAARHGRLAGSKQAGSKQALLANMFLKHRRASKAAAHAKAFSAVQPNTAVTIERSLSASTAHQASTALVQTGQAGENLVAQKAVPVEGLNGPFGRYSKNGAASTYMDGSEFTPLTRSECVTEDGLNLTFTEDKFKLQDATEALDVASNSWACRAPGSLAIMASECMLVCETISACNVIAVKSYDPKYPDASLELSGSEESLFGRGFAPIIPTIIPNMCALGSSATVPEVGETLTSGGDSVTGVELVDDADPAVGDPYKWVLYTRTHTLTPPTRLTIESFEDALYYSVITHTTVGFGDINGAMDFVAHQLAMLHSFVVFFINLAAVAAMMHDQDEEEQHKLIHLQEEYHDAEIPPRRLWFLNQKIADAHS